MAANIFLGKGGFHSARMQRHTDALRMAAPKLNSSGMHNLVHRRLGAAVADPAAQTVIPDRADPRRQYGKDCTLVARRKTNAGPTAFRANWSIIAFWVTALIVFSGVAPSISKAPVATITASNGPASLSNPVRTEASSVTSNPSAERDSVVTASPRDRQAAASAAPMPPLAPMTSTRALIPAPPAFGFVVDAFS